MEKGVLEKEIFGSDSEDDRLSAISLIESSDEDEPTSAALTSAARAREAEEDFEQRLKQLVPSLDFKKLPKIKKKYQSSVSYGENVATSVPTATSIT